jgi:hypothetical protein
MRLDPVNTVPQAAEVTAHLVAESESMRLDPVNTVSQATGMRSVVHVPAGCDLEDSIDLNIPCLPLTAESNRNTVTIEIEEVPAPAHMCSPSFRLDMRDDASIRAL